MDDKNSRTSPLRLVNSDAENTATSVSPLPTEGPELLNTVVSLTGLPEDLVELELLKVLEQTGCSGETLTLDELRSALLVYLETFKPDFSDLDSEKAEDATH